MLFISLDFRFSDTSDSHSRPIAGTPSHKILRQEYGVCCGRHVKHRMLEGETCKLLKQPPDSTSPEGSHPIKSPQNKVCTGLDPTPYAGNLMSMLGASWK